MQIPIGNIQDAIAHCMDAEQPAGSAVLPKDARILADVLGVMIYRKQTAFDAGDLTPAQHEALERWKAPHHAITV